MTEQKGGHGSARQAGPWASKPSCQKLLLSCPLPAALLNQLVAKGGTRLLDAREGVWPVLLEVGRCVVNLHADAVWQVLQLPMGKECHRVLPGAPSSDLSTWGSLPGGCHYV
jgi:hypothetical protein